MATQSKVIRFMNLKLEIYTGKLNFYSSWLVCICGQDAWCYTFHQISSASCYEPTGSCQTCKSSKTTPRYTDSFFRYATVISLLIVVFIRQTVENSDFVGDCFHWQINQHLVLQRVFMAAGQRVCVCVGMSLNKLQCVCSW